ncbi:inhibin beta E chain-like [Amphiura filiformis]|uniref:inhibin beta E chain-like n=1 Tax=Amphiura filiformis TaxID=82378 RepID=UPI003B215CD9
MRGLNLAILAAILIVKTVKVLGGPTNSLITSNYEGSDVLTPVYNISHTTEESPGPADLNFGEPELPQDELHGKESTPSKPQQSTPNDPGQTATRAAAATGLDSRSTSPPCPGCRLYQEDTELDRINRLERFKNRILQKLQLTRPPNISNPIINLPDEVFQIGQNQNNQPPRHQHHHRVAEKTESTSKVYLFADDQGCENTSKERRIRETTQCFRFPISPATKEQTLASAQLWVYLPPRNATTKQLRNIVATLPAEYYDARYTLAVKEDFIGDGWVELPLRHAIKRFVKSQHYIEIQSKPTPVGTEGPVRPILAMTYAMKNRERRQSSQNPNGNRCNPRHSCCMRSLQVTFAEIGWDWILQPPSYTANYCTGVCNTANPHGEYRNHHSHLLTTWLLNQPASSTRSIPSCCVPSSMGSLDIIFQDDNGVVNRTTLSDMTANGCHCVVN